MATTTRTPNNVYILNKIKEKKWCMGQVDESWLWNRRMGHMSFDNIVKVRIKEVARAMPKIIKPLEHVCKHCQHGKQTKMSFKANVYSTSKSLELAHIDLCGPTR